MLFGGGRLIACVAFIATSWLFFRKGSYSWALFFLVLTGLLIRTFVSLDPYLHPWDERYHALVAKNLLGHPFVPTLYDNPILPYDYKIWGANHVWLHKQPLPLWGIGASIKMFGANYFAVRLPSIILSGLGVFLAFVVGRKLFNVCVGYFTGFFFAVHGLITELVTGRMSTDHVDIFFTTFILLAVVCALFFGERRSVWWNIACGVAIGLAVLTKWLPALIVLPLWLMIVWHYKFKLREWLLDGVILIAVVCLVALPWQLYTHYSFPQEAAWESKYNVMHLYMDIENQGRPFWYFFDMMRMSYGELVYLPVIWFTYNAFKMKSNKVYWLVVAWLFVPYLIFSMSATKMQAYVLISGPAIFLITATMIDQLLDKRLLSRIHWLRYTVLTLLIALPLRFAYERLRPFQPTREVPDWQREINQFAGEVENPKRTIVFNTEHPIEYMFHCDVVAYEHLPCQRMMDSLANKQYQLFVVNDRLETVPWETVNKQ